MQVKSKLLPGENGTKGLLKQYGEQLVCVRYRYDQKRRKRYKTIELIVPARLFQDWLWRDRAAKAGKTGWRLLES